MVGGQITVLPGTYRSPTGTAVKPVTLTAPEPVLVEPQQGHGAWTQATVGGYSVWTAPLLNSGGKASASAVWAQSAASQPHRIPVWTNAAPLDTPDKWAAAVLSPANTHTRWGLYSTATSVYLVPPSAFDDPNAVAIWNTAQNGLNINGPDVQLLGPFSFYAGGVRLDSSAVRAVVDGARIFGAPKGIAIYAGGNAHSGWTYGQDHVFRNLTIADDGAWLMPGESPVAGQQISWYIVKSHGFDLGLRDADGNPVLVSRAVGGSESVAFYTQGGAANVLVEDCEFDGTFDGASHYMPNSSYDANADAHLTFRRIRFRNHPDDSLDRSRWQDDVLVESSTFYNVGDILSPAPLWGSVTVRNCTGMVIGEQVRVPDGNGLRPPGSIIKYGANDGSEPQGHVTIQDCQFWTDTQTTQGFAPDGGDGRVVPAFDIHNSLFRVGSIVVNYGGGNYSHPTADFTYDAQTVFSTSSTRPLKVGSSLADIPLTSPVVADAVFRSGLLDKVTG